MPGLDVSQISSNWKRLQAQLKTESKTRDAGPTLKRKRSSTEKNAITQSRSLKRAKDEKRPTGSRSKNTGRNMGNYASSKPVHASETANVSHSDLQRDHEISNDDLSAAYGGFHELSSKDKINDGRHKIHKAGKYLALDCEMVGTGPPPHTDDVLARVSIVNFHGEQVYDSYVQSPSGVKVEDYRTHVSGIEAKHMRDGVARSFTQVQNDIADLLEGRILVGHALKKDLQALQLNHAQRDTRDTSRHAAFRIESRGKPPALRNLAMSKLGVTIQQGAHSSLEDARATMMLFKKDKVAFEEESRRLYGTSRSNIRNAVVPNATQNEDISDEDEEDLESELLDGEDDQLELDVTQAATITKTKKKRKKKKRTKR